MKKNEKTKKEDKQVIEAIIRHLEKTINTTKEIIKEQMDEFNSEIIFDEDEEFKRELIIEALRQYLYRDCDLLEGWRNHLLRLEEEEEKCIKTKKN